MTPPFNLDFEKPIVELEQQIAHLKHLAAERQLEVRSEIMPLESKLVELRREIYRSLTPLQRVQVARHPLEHSDIGALRRQPARCDCTQVTVGSRKQCGDLVLGGARVAQGKGHS